MAWLTRSEAKAGAGTEPRITTHFLSDLTHPYAPAVSYLRVLNNYLIKCRAYAVCTKGAICHIIELLIPRAQIYTFTTHHHVIIY